MHKNNKLVLVIFILLITTITYQITTTGFAVKNLTCTDSDKGINIFEKGAIKGYKFSLLKQSFVDDTREDKCIPYDNEPSKNRVREHYCKDYKVIRRNIPCPEGTICMKGACT